MNIKILATTNSDVQDKELFNILGGKYAGVCYMKNSITDLLNEPMEKTQKRALIAMENGHHSVFEHSYITLYLEDVPKMFAMLLNNENVYVTSEKSARYTNMIGEGLNKELYDKWYKIFVDKITEKYGNEEYFTTSRIDKLAKENARYFLSVYTPTSLVYTTSYRQLNYLYNWLNNLQNTENKYLKPLIPIAKEFCINLKQHNLIDNFDDGKNREFSLFKDKKAENYFGDVYTITYKGSFASLGQTQRHRSLNYNISPVYPYEYFVPRIIKKNEKLKNMWLEDMALIKETHPQAELVNIVEKGTPENFLLKVQERLCTCAQQEIMEQTKDTLKTYIENTTDKQIKDQLSLYNNGARCTSGYNCKTPCKFKQGITLEREI